MVIGPNRLNIVSANTTFPVQGLLREPRLPPVLSTKKITVMILVIGIFSEKIKKIVRVWEYF
ncbi:MAG: hypothetical protein A2Y79_04900 [Deltaproteobacteria bacterium RBG_13_43_22]|nr:MAG: hypothetical protein A2Y79_04900 [Deltaproteobacteria bacterium RBG_13_43_22]